MNKEKKIYPLSEVGTSVSIGRKVINRSQVFETTLLCEWEEDGATCNQVFKQEFSYSPCDKEVFFLASFQGWQLVDGKIQCGCHLTTY